MNLNALFLYFRMMRSHTNDNWKGFYPKTNIFWLHYLLDKTLNEVKYKTRYTKAKIHRKGLSKLRLIKDRVLEYNSCQSFVRWYHFETSGL